MRQHYDGGGKKTIALALTLHVSRRTVQRWAIELGLRKPQPPRPSWLTFVHANSIAATKEPRKSSLVGLLDGYAHKRSWSELAHRTGRSETAVRWKMHREGITKLGNDYTGVSLAEALGCAPERVYGWIKRGWLPDTRRESDRPAAVGDYYLLRDRDIARLFLSHAADVFPDGATMEQCVWLASVLRDAQDVVSEA